MISDTVPPRTIATQALSISFDIVAPRSITQKYILAPCDITCTKAFLCTRRIAIKYPLKEEDIAIGVKEMASIFNDDTVRSSPSMRTPIDSAEQKRQNETRKLIIREKRMLFFIMD